MGNVGLRWQWVLVSSFLLSGLGIEAALAQPIPDETLGEERSQVREFNSTIDLIEGGATRGRNLFHSFREFNIDAGRAAYFIHQLGIENIFSRVTGGTRSEINGVLGIRGFENGAFVGSEANLFLMNPNGIVFGPNSSLDVGGSFVATTANGIQFGEQGFFSATNPEAPSQLLTIDPSAFLFNQIPIGNIANNSRVDAGRDPSDSFNVFGLRVPDDNSFLLLGGNITTDGGGIVAFGGRIELGSVAGIGTIELNAVGDSLSFNFPENVERADVTLTNRAGFLATTGTRGGNITITARHISILNGSSIQAGIGSNLGNIDSQAGDVTLDAQEGVTIAGGGSLLVNSVYPEAIGNGGDINITANAVQMNSGAQIVSIVFGRGNTGSVRIIAGDSVSLDGRNPNNPRFPSAVFTSIQEGATGISEGRPSTTGGIYIDTGSLSLTNRSQLNSTTAGVGSPGDIVIEARDRVFMQNTLIVTEVTEEVGVGDASDIWITTGTLELRDGSALLADTENLGNAGDIVIKARDAIILSGRGPSAFRLDIPVSSQITSTVDFVEPDESAFRGGATGVGEGGDITITTDSLSIDDGGFIRTSTLGEGNAGNVGISAERISVQGGGFIAANTLGNGNSGDLTIRASEIDLSGVSSSDESASALSTAVDGDATGNGGQLTITANQLAISNGALIKTDTSAQGNAGNVIIDARDISLTGSSAITTLVGAGAEGEGGDIRITTGSLRLTDFARLDTQTAEQGSAGDIFVNADSLTLGNNAEISAQSTGLGRAGDITLTIADRLRVHNSQILTAAEQSSGGAITINAENVDVRLSGTSDISTSVSSGAGSGGNIDVRANTIELHDDSDIRTSVAGGQGSGGNIRLSASSILAFGDSDVIAAAPEGQGGDINFDTNAFFGENYFGTADRSNNERLTQAELDALERNEQVDVNASGQVSAGTITTPDTSVVQNSLTALPDVAIDTDTLVANSCVVRSQEQTGTFIITGPGGLPQRPSSIAPSTYPTAPVRSLPDANPDDRSWQPGDAIVEPQGAYQLEDGRWVLSRECS